MKVSPNNKAGFTLVEILIVVVILGILAAIVIPQFTNASEEARLNSVVTQLQTLRSQLELFQIQHNGDYPDLDGAAGEAQWNIMTQNSDPTETVSSTADDTGDLGPYMQQAPANPFEDSVSVAAAAAAGVGWVYDSATGDIRICMETGKATDLGVNTNVNDFSIY